jgi:hypothetical protein
MKTIISNVAACLCVNWAKEVLKFFELSIKCRHMVWRTQEEFNASKLGSVSEPFSQMLGMHVDSKSKENDVRSLWARTMLVKGRTGMFSRLP